MRGGIGSLRHRVQFSRRKTEESDKYGNPKREYEPLFVVWGNVRETPGKERIAAGSVEGVRTAIVRIRSDSRTRELTSNDRIEARGKIWGILGIANADDKGAMLEILVQSGGGA